MQRGDKPFIEFCFLDISFGIVLFIISTTFIYSQSETLLESINSTDNLQQKRLKIDSLISTMEKKADTGKLAEFYHDLASKFFFINWWNHRAEKDLENALLYSRKSLAIKRVQKDLEQGSLDKTLYNLGYFSSLKGDVFDAIDYYRLLIDIGKENRLIQKAHIKLGNLWVQTGDFYKGLEQFDISHSFYIQKDILDKSDGLRLADICLLKASTYAKMGYRQYEKKIKLNLSLADSLLKAKKISNSDFDNSINQLAGNLLLKLGRNSEAIPYFETALKDSSTLEAYNLARVINSLALSQMKIKNFDTAFSNLNRAIFYDSNYSDPYNNLGSFYFSQNEFKKGLFYCQKAIVYETNKTKDIKYDENLNIEDLGLASQKVTLLNHIITKANGWISFYKHDNNKNNLVHAIKTFILADQLVDILRTENTEYQSKLFWREQGASLYMKAVEVSYLLEKPKEAYYFMERNKALLLLEDLTNEEAKEIAQIPTEKAQQEFDLKRAIFLSENILQENLGGLNKDSLANLKQIVRKNKYNYEKFIDSLNTSYPNYAKFKKKVDVLSYKDLKANHITENKAILHYILNESDGYGLLTTADTTALFRLDNVANLNKNVEQLIADLSNGISDINDFRKISNTVFQKLFPQDIYEKIKGKQLTIVPDYTLQQIPFESLVIDTTGLKYLFQDVEIGYAYSASLLDHNQKERLATDIDFIGIAPIVFDSLQLPELYFSENEVKNIAAVYSGNILLNGEASKNNFIENADKHNVLHLATHADIGDGDNPWVAFSDSKMYLKEIYATKNRADMVVLSGCNTSIGELKRGEGVMSLARGFFYSGAKSVVSTMWPVADEAGKDILINFYKSLNNGLTKSKALQKAKLDYLENTEEEELKHPYYWAGYVVLGDNSPISEKPISPWLLAGLGFVATGLLLLGYKKIKARRAAA